MEPEDAEWMNAPMGPQEAVPSLEEVKDSLPAELTAQRKALEAHIQAWLLQRQEANSHACDLQEALEEARQFREKIQKASDQYGYSHSDEFMDVIFAILSKEGE